MRQILQCSKYCYQGCFQAVYAEAKLQRFRRTSDMSGQQTAFETNYVLKLKYFKDFFPTSVKNLPVQGRRKQYVDGQAHLMLGRCKTRNME